MKRKGRRKNGELSGNVDPFNEKWDTFIFMKNNQIGSHKHSKGPTKAGWLVWLCKIKWGPSPYNFGFLSPKQSLWILEPSSSSFSLSLSFLFFIIPSFVSLASRFYSLFHPPKIIPNQQSRLSRWSCSYYCNSVVIISIYLTNNTPAYTMWSNGQNEKHYVISKLFKLAWMFHFPPLCGLLLRAWTSV